MVEPVIRLLIGNGFKTVRARDAGLATEPDELLVDYALANELIIVTFDGGLRAAGRRRGCRCLLVRPPEVTALDRLRIHLDTVVELFRSRRPLVILPSDGPPRPD